MSSLQVLASRTGRLLWLIAFFTWQTLVLGSNSTGTVRQTKVDVLGQSGKVTIWDGAKGSKGEDPNAVTMQIDFVKELTSTGANTGKHEIGSFATQNFAVTSSSTTFGGATVTKITFGTDLDPPGQTSKFGRLEVDTYVFESATNVSTDTETWAVKAGDMKWAIRLSDWTWCTAANERCKQGNSVPVGDMVAVGVEIKGKGSASAKQGSGGKDFDLGGGITMKLSDRTYNDGATWAAMPSGFPSLSSSGSKQLFTFRFAKFNQRSTYDPVMSAEEPASMASSASGNQLMGGELGPLQMVFLSSVLGLALSGAGVLGTEL